jgi:hypothetical protein
MRHKQNLVYLWNRLVREDNSQNQSLKGDFACKSGQTALKVAADTPWEYSRHVQQKTNLEWKPASNSAV